jgi:hypothetical protein
LTKNLCCHHFILAKKPEKTLLPSIKLWLPCPL